MKQVAFFVLCLVAGIGAATVRLAYFFFPGANVMDVLVFGALGAGLGYLRPVRWWLWVTTFLVPVMLVIARSLARLGSESLSQGIGTGHALSLVLVPLAAAIGSGLAARLARRAVGAESTTGV